MFLEKQKEANDLSFAMTKVNQSLQMCSKCLQNSCMNNTKVFHLLPMISFHSKIRPEARVNTYNKKNLMVRNYMLNSIS